MGDEHMRTIEVEGHKFEVDLRTAKKIDLFRVGDKVKVLTKSYSGWETHPGVIVGIDGFKSLPTIVIAYVDNVLGASGNIKFAYLNSQSKEIEICPMCEDDVLPNRETVVMYFDKAIDKHAKEIADITTKKEFFLRMYGATIATAAEEIVVNDGESIGDCPL